MTLLDGIHQFCRRIYAIIAGLLLGISAAQGFVDRWDAPLRMWLLGACVGFTVFFSIEEAGRRKDLKQRRKRLEALEAEIEAEERLRACVRSEIASETPALPEPETLPTWARKEAAR